MAALILETNRDRHRSEVVKRRGQRDAIFHVYIGQFGADFGFWNVRTLTQRRSYYQAGPLRK